MTTTLPAEAGTAEMTERERFIDGLRVLAAALETHPDLPLPSDGTTSFGALCWSFWGDDAREQMAETARLLPCSWRKQAVDADPGGRWEAMFKLHGQIGGVYVRLIAERDAVCRKVVTGTREVTEEIPIPTRRRSRSRAWSRTWNGIAARCCARSLRLMSRNWRAERWTWRSAPESRAAR